MNCKVKRGFIIALLLTFTATLFMFLSIARTSDKGFADGYVAQEFTATTNYDFSIEDGVSIKISKFENDVQNAMRFVTKLKTTDFQEGYKIVTLITLTEYLEDAGLNNSKFTLDNLDGLGVKYTKVTFSADNQNVTSQEKDGYYVYNACIYNIKDANYTKEFCARSYVTDANGNVTQYTETYADAVLWDVANAHKENIADDVQGDSDFGPNKDMTEKAYVSSLCQTYDVTINNATGTPYVKTVKHGEQLSKHINTEFGKKVVKIENFLYPSAYVDGEGRDCSNDIITTDISLTAEYDQDGAGAILIDETTVTGVGSKFFDYTTEVVIPDDLSIDEIGVVAFAGKTKLTMIKMPESVTKIGREAFFGCKNLETVIMPGVTYIGVNEGGEGVYRHFMNCYALKSLVVGETFKLELVTDRGVGENRCFYVEGTGAVPNQVSIYLTSSDGTATLHAEGATSRVQNMLSGDRVYNLSENGNACGTWSWDGDEPKLSEYATHENQDGICSRCGLETTAGLTYTKYTDKEEYYVSSYTGSATEVYVRAKYENLPVTAIGKNVFDGNTRITKVVMPSVTTIGGFAFQNCTALKTVIMPKVTNITTSSDEYYQFYQCNSLTTIVVGESFTVSYGPTGMYARAFYTEDTSCIGKTKVYISSSGGVMAVASTSNYNKLINSTPYYLNETENDICGMWRWVNGEPTLSENTSHNYVDDVCANCGEEKYTAGLLFAKYGDKEEYYVSAYNGSDTEVLVPSKYLGLPVVAIGVSSFTAKASTTTITKVVMPESVTTIHGNAFFGCSALKTIIMPGVTSITTIASANSLFGRVENNHFYGCTSLEKIVVGASLEVLVGAGTSGGDQRVFWTDGYTGTGIDVYLTSSDGTLYVQAPSRCNMLTNTVYHYSKTRPADEALATTWDYYNGVPTLWQDIPVAE